MRLRTVAKIIFTTLALLGSLEAGASTTVPRTQPRRIVMAIGVNKFDDDKFKDVNFAAKDARDVTDALMKKAKPSFDKEILVSSDTTSDGRVPLGELREAMAKVEAANLREDDTVVIYLSTHGTVLRHPDGMVRRHILVSDSQSQNLAASSLAFDELTMWFKGLRSRKKALVLAFCYSGVGRSVLTPNMLMEVARLRGGFFTEPDIEVAEGSVILAASGWQEPARESPVLQNEVYTHFLVKGFEHGDTNGDGAVSITEAHAYATDGTAVFTRNEQNPSAISEIKGRDPIIINGTPSRTRNALLFAGYSQYRSLEARWNGRSLGVLSRGISLPEGRGKLVIIDPSTSRVVASKVAAVQAGEEYLVTDFLAPRQSHFVSAGVGLFEEVGGRSRRRLMPERTVGLDIRYDWNEAFFNDLIGLQLGFLAAPPIEETIEVAGLSFRQKRSSYLMLLGLTSSWKLSSLSSIPEPPSGQLKAPFVWDTSLVAGAGPSLLCLERTIDSEAFKRKRQKGCMAGAHVSTGVSTYMPTLRMTTDLSFMGLVNRNPVADSNDNGNRGASAGSSTRTHWTPSWGASARLGFALK